jgi:glycosyltransferase involved in cell wall biosynthesis
LKANIIYSDLNHCGGGERLTLVTMQAILEMGIDIELTTLEKPNIRKLENAYGKGIASIIKSIKKVNILRLLDEQSINNIMKEGYDIIINTHGDIIPYYNKSFSKKNAITYCHFPSAKFFIQSENKAYLERHLKIARESSSNSLTSDLDQHTTQNNNIVDFNKKRYLEWLKDAYDNLMKNSTILTNSDYTHKAIFKTYGIDDAIILNPPVDVDIFRNSTLLLPSSDEREDIILVVSRIDPFKRIENAIMVAKLLKENNMGKGMKIVGSLDYYYYDYYSHLKKMIVDFNLVDYVTLEIDISLDKLLSVMSKSKVYFHPRPREHFGISIVEAMSAGLVPVVPDIGGQTEFVPSKYHFHTLEQAAQIMSSAFNIPDSERILISNSVNKFSASNYIRGFQQVINKLFPNMS